MKTIRQQLKKIAPCFYRHEETGNYYGIKKVRGKIKKCSLGTDDRKLAERKLKDWAESFERRTGEIDLKGFCDVFLETRNGKRQSTIHGYQRAIKWLLDYIPGSTPVHDIKPSVLSKIFADSASGYSGSTHNHLTANIGLIFELAFNDGYLAENPCNRVNKTLKTKKIAKKKTRIPTEQQFRALLDHLRSFYVTADRQELADIVEFFALASIGEAEALALRWEDINWSEEKIEIKRVKTSQLFHIPFYPWLKPFLVSLWERRGRPMHGQIFSVTNIHMRLRNACQTLKTPRFTSRSLRKFGITKLLRAGLPVKNISAYQGHRDGGKLIWNTYSEVISEDSKAYEKNLVASLKW